MADANGGRDGPDPQRDARPRGSRLRRWLQRGVAMVVGCVAAALLFEVLVLVFIGQQPKFPRHVVGASWGLRYNEPGAAYRHKSADCTVRFKINAQGMRMDRDVAYAKPPGAKRVMVVGDSFAIGYEVERSECFASVLERELAARGMPVEVLNAGVSGLSTAEECLYLERELLKYDPDIVVVQFFGNDLEGSTRTGLFRLEGGKLVEGRHDYVPLGRIANMLNTNPVLSWLSERSDGFVYVKEALNTMLKHSLGADQLRATPAPGSGPAPGEPMEAHATLTAAIFERMYETLHAKNIPLVILSIPEQPDGPSGPLVEFFPVAEFKSEREGLAFVPTNGLFDPHVGHDPLYFQRSMGHWTPLAHDIAGKELARVIGERGWIGSQPP